MAFSLIPNLIVDSITDLTPELLLARGVTFLMMDFDNTLVPYTEDIPTDAVEQWLQSMQESTVTICMVSNSKRDRVRIFCEQRGIPCIQFAKKPFWRVGIKQALDRFEVDAKQAAMVGDQIYTDVLGGNGAGATSILVRPIHLHNIWLKLRHVAELPFIAIGKWRLNHEKH